MSGQRPKQLCAADGVLPDVGSPAQWLHQTFFRCPITGQRQRIIAVRGAEAGLNCLEITTIGPRRAREQRTAWRHRIYSTEVDPAVQLGGKGVENGAGQQRPDERT